MCVPVCGCVVGEYIYSCSIIFQGLNIVSVFMASESDQTVLYLASYRRVRGLNELKPCVALSYEKVNLHVCIYSEISNTPRYYFFSNEYLHVNKDVSFFSSPVISAYADCSSER